MSVINISREKTCANFLTHPDFNQKGLLSSRCFLRQWYILGYLSFANRSYRKTNCWQEALEDTFIDGEADLRPVEDEEVAGCTWQRYEAPAVFEKSSELKPECIKVHAFHRLSLQPSNKDAGPPPGVHATLNHFTLEDELNPVWSFTEGKTVPFCARCGSPLFDFPSSCPKCGQRINARYNYYSAKGFPTRTYRHEFPDDYSISYLAAYFHAPADLTKVQLGVGSDALYRIWINGREVGRYEGPVRYGCWDQDIYEVVKLQAGWNVILVKLVHLTEDEDEGRFYARLATKDSEPLFVNDFADETTSPESQLRITIDKPIFIGLSHSIPVLLRCANGTLVVNEYRSTDNGKTWEPCPSICPLKDDGSPIAVNTVSERALSDGTYISIGQMVVETEPGFFMTKMLRTSDGWRTVSEEEVIIHLPQSYQNVDEGNQPSGPWISHGLSELPNGDLLALIYGYFKEDQVYIDRRIQGWLMWPHEWKMYKYRTWVIRSSDGSHRWEYLSTVAAYPELGWMGFCEANLKLLNDGELICVLRNGNGCPLWVCRSTDQGRSWTYPEPLRLKGVWPTVVNLSNGILALTFGRPDCRIAFSITGTGSDWSHETIIFNGNSQCYTSAVEISEGTLFYVFDELPLRDWTKPRRLFGVQIKAERL